jgi:hypothetical protein
VFTSAKGKTTMKVATLTAGTAPAVTAQPADPGPLTANQEVTLTSAASGSPVPKVQSQVSTDGGRTFTNMKGATKPTYSLVASALVDGTRRGADLHDHQERNEEHAQGHGEGEPVGLPLPGVFRQPARASTQRRRRDCRLVSWGFPLASLRAKLIERSLSAHRAPCVWLKSPRLLGSFGHLDTGRWDQTPASCRAGARAERVSALEGHVAGLGR